MRARHGDELLRSVEPHRLVSQGSKIAEITARSTAEIKKRIRRGALYRIEECRVILADIVLSRTVPEGTREPIIKRDRRLAETPDLLGIIRFRGAAHRPSPISAHGWCRRRPAAAPGNRTWLRPLKER